jgi:hypothetical protein
VRQPRDGQRRAGPALPGLRPGDAPGGRRVDPP